LDLVFIIFIHLWNHLTTSYKSTITYILPIQTLLTPYLPHHPQPDPNTKQISNTPMSGYNNNGQSYQQGPQYTSNGNVGYYPPQQQGYQSPPPQTGYGTAQSYDQQPLAPAGEEVDYDNTFAPQPGYVPTPHPPVTLYYGYNAPHYGGDIESISTRDEPIEAPKCQDPCCAVTFILALIAFISLAGFSYSLAITGTVPVEHDWQLSPQARAIIGISIGISAVCSFGMLFFIKSNAACMIWTTLLFNAAVWIVGGVVMIAMGVFFGAIPIAVGILMTIYPWCVRYRIQFVAVMIKHSINALNKYPGVFGASLIGSLATIASFTLTVTAATRFSTWYNTEAGFTHEEENTGILLVLALSFLFFWVCEFARGWVHTVIAGVVGTFWYLPNQTFATGPSMKRASTTSMGSIAFGTLLVATAQFCRMLAHVKFKQVAKARGGGKNAGLLLIVLIFLACLGCLFSIFERTLKWINHYAFTFVALYGRSYMESGKNVMELFFNSGFMMIVQKDLTGFVISLGMLLATGLSAGLTLLLFWTMNWADFSQYEPGAVAYLASMVFIISMYTSLLILTPLQSAVTTTFVTWSEDGAAMQSAHPVAFNEMVDARNKVFM